jgi:hypothetical protein
MNDNLLEAQDQLTADPNKNYLEELVGEGKKFKSVEDLARGKYEADLFIAHKNKEYDTLREDYVKLFEEQKTAKTLEEMIDRISQKPLGSESTLNADSVMNQPKYDPKEVETLFEQKFREKTIQQTQAQNLNFVKDKLIEKFGPNYQTHVKAQIEDLGISDAEFTTLAKANPKLVIRTLGLDRQQTEDFDAPPRSSVRSDNFSPKGATKRDWSFYEKMRKEDPKQYTNPKTQVQMHQDAIAYGDSFYA